MHPVAKKLAKWAHLLTPPLWEDNVFLICRGLGFEELC